MKQLRARLYEFEMEKKREETRKTEASKLDINFGSQIRSYVLAPVPPYQGPPHEALPWAMSIACSMAASIPSSTPGWCFARPETLPAMGRTSCRSDLRRLACAGGRDPAQWRSGGIPHRDGVRLGSKCARCPGRRSHLPGEGPPAIEPSDRTRRFGRYGESLGKRMAAGRPTLWRDAFWPGPLTLVVPKRPQIPDNVTAGLLTVGLRQPDHPVAAALIREAACPYRRAERESLHGPLADNGRACAEVAGPERRSDSRRRADSRRDRVNGVVAWLARARFCSGPA